MLYFFLVLICVTRPCNVPRHVTARLFVTIIIIIIKIKKEAPSKDAERRMLEAWNRRTMAYHKMMSMLAASRPSTKSTSSTAVVVASTTTSLQLDSCA